jgi:hypothetical protein
MYQRASQRYPTYERSQTTEVGGGFQMSHKTCRAACVIASLTVFTLFGCSGVDHYRSVQAGPVVTDKESLTGPVGADTGSLIVDLFVIIAILAALVLIEVSLMLRFVKGKSGTAHSGFRRSGL